MHGDVARNHEVPSKAVSFVLGSCERWVAHVLLTRTYLAPDVAAPLAETPYCSTRAVDTLCRSQFTALTTCLEGGDASKCVKQQVAFDVCTEDF